MGDISTQVSEDISECASPLPAWRVKWWNPPVALDTHSYELAQGRERESELRVSCTELLVSCTKLLHDLRGFDRRCIHESEQVDGDANNSVDAAYEQGARA